LGPATASHWLRIQHDQLRSPAFKRFSSFLACCRPPVQDPQDIDRALLERYLA
jgi:hypothetical protein